MDDEWLEQSSLTWQQAEELGQLLPNGTPVERLNRNNAAGLFRLLSPITPWRKKPPPDRQESFLQYRGL